MNPDEIKDERYAKPFCTLFAIIEKQRKEQRQMTHLWRLFRQLRSWV